MRTFRIYCSSSGSYGPHTVHYSTSPHLQQEVCAFLLPVPAPPSPLPCLSFKDVCVEDSSRSCPQRLGSTFTVCHKKFSFLSSVFLFCNITHYMALLCHPVGTGAQASVKEDAGTLTVLAAMYSKSPFIYDSRVSCLLPHP